MVFHCVVGKKEQNRSKWLQGAALESGLVFNVIDPEDFNYLEQPEIKRGDILYRASPGERGQVLEAWLYRKGLRTFYNNSEKSTIGFNRLTPMVYGKAGLPMPRTFQHLTRDREILRGYVRALGGFPVVVKVFPGSEGTGVMKVDSFGALFSLVDYLAEKESVYMMREFISVADEAIHSNRAVVIGEEVVLAYRNESVEHDDFRSNCNQVQRRRVKLYLTPDQQKILVEAVRLLGIDLGAVDFLMDDEKETMYLLETNFPFNFVPIIESLDFPIHKGMVDFLKNKKVV